MTRIVSRVGVVAAVLCAGVALTATSVRAEPGNGVVTDKSSVGPRADFNGDGDGDLAIGVPGEDVGSASNAGGVNVLYGSPTGLASAHNQFWSQDSSGIAGTAEDGDAFGQAVAVGDFNHDGFSDLAVAAPFDSVGATADAGAVNVIYGSSQGLRAAGNQLWDQNSKGVHNTAGEGDEFGFSLAARDFNDDGFTDLAIGVPGEDGTSAQNAGGVEVLYGSAHGLKAKGDQFVGGVSGGDRFGTALAAGNFDGTGGADLAVGAPDATNDGRVDAGIVFALTGTSNGLKGLAFTLNTIPNAGAHCGASLTALNWDNDAAGRADVAAGCPDAPATGQAKGGLVDLHLGTATGLSDGIGEIVSPDPQQGAAFGSAVAAGDVGNDHGGSDDLIVGEPLFDIGDQPDAGRIFVVYDNHGPAFQVFHQGLAGTRGKPEGGDLFGAAVTTGNFDGDGWADVAVGVPGEGLGSRTDGEGGVNVLYGTGGGLATARNQFWSQDSTGIAGTAEPEDFFGDALSGRTG